jgi:hypothetical protein
VTRVHADGREHGGTFVPENPYAVNDDRPLRRIDQVLVR